MPAAGEAGRHWLRNMERPLKQLRATVSSALSAAVVAAAFYVVIVYRAFGLLDRSLQLAYAEARADAEVLLVELV